MKFQPTRIAGVVVVEPDRHADERGFFLRSFCREAFAAHGLGVAFAQCATSYNLRRGTLRGLHYQRAPVAEAKLVRCVRGAAYDVALDLRPASATRGAWVAVRLSAREANAVFIPEGCAHGFQTLEDDTELFYQITAPYRPEAEAGVRWNDPTLAIDWPVQEPILSQRDRTLPTFEAIAC